MTQKTLLQTACFILFLFTASALFAQQSANNAEFNKLLDDYYEEGLKLNPISATAAGDPRYNDLLPNSISVPHLQKVHDYNVKYRKLLSAFNRASLNAYDQISFAIVKLQTQQALAREKFHLEYMPFSQFDGLPVSFPSLGSGKDLQPFKTVKDYDNWLKRVDAFAVWVDTAIANFNKGIATGMVLPRALVVKMIPQMEAQTVADTAKNIFYGPIKNMPAGFSPEQRAATRLAYQNAINNIIIPAYRKLTDYLKNVYLPKARTTSGINDLPNGTAMYQFQIEVFTTTNKTPEEIYQTGLNELERITKEIEALKTKIGFSGSMEEFFNFALKDKQFFPFKTDEEILDTYRAILPKIEPNLKKLFNIIPKTKFEVRAIEKFKAATSAANYQRGTEDGSRPGISTCRSSMRPHLINWVWRIFFCMKRSRATISNYRCSRKIRLLLRSGSLQAILFFRRGGHYILNRWGRNWDCTLTLIKNSRPTNQNFLGR